MENFTYSSSKTTENVNVNDQPNLVDQSVIPIVFIHQHYTPYLEFTLRQAVHTNPDSPVHLLGDEENDRFPFLIHDSIKSLRSADSARFAAVYQHDSPNQYGYELFCFERWFLVKELMARQGYQQVFVADSDVMIFSDLTDYVNQHARHNYFAAFNVGSDYQWVRSASGHSSYWTWEGINRFCELAIQLYTEPRLMAFMDKIRADKKAKNDKAGISDMTALYVFYEEFGSRILNLSQCSDNGVFDHNICMSTNYSLHEYEFRSGHKKITMQQKTPVCYNRLLHQPVTMHTLHFQGGSKNIVHRYFTGKGLFRERIFRELRYQTSRVYRTVRPVKKG